MQTGKYGHLIKPLGPGALPRDPATGPGGAARLVCLTGRDQLEGIPLSLAWGVHTATGSWHGFLDPHAHAAPECLLFVGLDTASIRYLGAEVSVCLGEEQETYTFDEPTAVVIPPGLPHGPIRTERVYSPRGFGCWSVQLDGAPGITPMGAGVPEVSARQRQAAPEGMRFAEAGGILKNGPAPPSGKYARLVEPLKSFILVERGHVNPSRLARIHPAAPPPDPPAGDRPGPGSADHMAWITGGDLEGFGATVVWGFCSRPGISRRGVGAHVHPGGEVLVYLGMDPRDPEALGAELEIDLGPEHERHLVTASSAVVCPAGVPHMPQLTRWVDRPFGFFAVCLDGGHRTDAVD